MPLKYTTAAQLLLRDSEYKRSPQWRLRVDSLTFFPIIRVACELTFQYLGKFSAATLTTLRSYGYRSLNGDASVSLFNACSPNLPPRWRSGLLCGFTLIDFF